MKAEAEFDDIVVGAGTAGCVLGGRLSEDPERQVLLLEAGVDFPTLEQTPSSLLNAAAPALDGFDWKLTARMRAENTGKRLLTAARTFASVSGGDKVGTLKGLVRGSDSPGGNMLVEQPYFIGKVVGGSSAINGAVAMRPAPADIDEWTNWAGNDWTWNKVLPYFRRLEDDRDYDGDCHGRGGPIPIRRYRNEELTPAQRGFWQACRDLGYAEIMDHNHPDSDAGVGVVPTNVRNGQRVYTALAYLSPARKRPNLTIRDHSLVLRVLFNGRRAIGVEYERHGIRQQVLGRRIILAAGAVLTPTVLLRSGIGPEAELARLGVTPVVSLPGVGENLIDHTAIVMWAVPKPGVCVDGQPVHQALLRYTAAQSAQINDMHLYMLGNVDLSWLPLQHMMGCQRALAISTVLTRPASRGRITLSNTAADSRPEIVFNCLSDSRDMPRLAEGVRLAWRIMCSPELADLVERVFIWNEAILAKEAALHNTIRTFISTSFHPVGTARMGTADDANAVVDPHCKVHGVDQLRVVDASVMPNIPSFPTGLTCIMLAERVADWLRTTEQ